MYTHTQALTLYLKNNGITFEYVERSGKSDLLVIKYRINELTVLDVLVFLEEDCESISFRCFTGLRVPHERRLSVYESLNELNGAYRCVKFYIDGDEVVIGSDTVSDGDSPEASYMMLGRVVNVAQTVYPQIFAKIIE